MTRIEPKSSSSLWSPFYLTTRVYVFVVTVEVVSAFASAIQPLSSFTVRMFIVGVIKLGPIIDVTAPFSLELRHKTLSPRLTLFILTGTPVEDGMASAILGLGCKNIMLPLNTLSTGS